MSDERYRWRGFALPTYTPIPDEFFDELVIHLNEAELRVLLYLMRRTFGFKKEADSVSLKQLVEGIVTREGKPLDHGTGMSKSAVQRGLKGLREKQVVVAERNRTPEQGDTATTYRLRLVGEGAEGAGATPWSAGGPGGTPLADQAVDRWRTTQETVIQETERQEFEDSNGLDVKNDSTRSVIAAYLADFARELHDQAPLPSSVGRAVNLYRESGWPLERFLEALYTARATTQQYSASIKAEPVGDGAWPAKPKMAYFFAVLEDVLELKERATG